MKFKYCLLVAAYFFLLVGYVFYSYTQIDLNLTLSSNFFYQDLQRQLIHLGYFRRSASALIYLILVILFFIFYFLFLFFVKKKRISYQEVWFLILGQTIILLFSYPAFSHDIFNYIFDARILIYHRANPWTTTALDFPNDLWTRFMHWTHRTYPYGPFWLVVSLIPYLLGVGKFTLTLLNFKLLLAVSYLGCCFFIYKILLKKTSSDALLGLVFFAFNPLILTETIISPHLDIFMVVIGLVGIYLILENKHKWGTGALFLSILTKYATVGYLPILASKIKSSQKLLLMIGLTALAIIVQIYMREILPWYFIPLVALVSLSENYLIKVLIYGISIGGLLYYLPYLYFGEITILMKTWRLVLFFLPIFISLTYSLWKKIKLP